MFTHSQSGNLSGTPRSCTLDTAFVLLFSWFFTLFDPFEGYFLEEQYRIHIYMFLLYVRSADKIDEKKEVSRIDPLDTPAAWYYYTRNCLGWEQDERGNVRVGKNQLTLSEVFSLVKPDHVQIRSACKGMKNETKTPELR